jgi:hypothetical protein
MGINGKNKAAHLVQSFLDGVSLEACLGGRLWIPQKDKVVNRRWLSRIGQDKDWYL